MSAAALARKLADLGATPEVIVAALEALEQSQSDVDARKASARERKQRQRDRERDSHGTVTGQSRDEDVTPPLSLPPNEKISNPPTHTPGDITTHARKGRPSDADFEAWWSGYPRKVEKPTARKAFAKAWADIADPDPLRVLTEAVARYVERTDPAYLKHPTTWLNKGCWSDEDPTPPLKLVKIHDRPDPVSRRDGRINNMLAGAMAAVDEQNAALRGRR
jgi:hypothetical protein